MSRSIAKDLFHNKYVDAATALAVASFTGYGSWKLFLPSQPGIYSKIFVAILSIFYFLVSFIALNEFFRNISRENEDQEDGEDNNTIQVDKMPEVELEVKK